MLILPRVDDHITALILAGFLVFQMKEAKGKSWRERDPMRETSGYESHNIIHWGLVNFKGLTCYDHYN